MGVRTSLTVDQHTRYEFLKKEIREYIQKGIEAFERVAADMLEIRDQRLYREEFGTFEEFCRETLGRSKTQVNRMIQAGDVIKGLMAAGETVLPNNFRIAYELALYPPRDRQLIWKRARQIADRNDGKRTNPKEGRSMKTTIIERATIATIEVLSPLPPKYNSQSKAGFASLVLNAQGRSRKEAHEDR